MDILSDVLKSFHIDTFALASIQMREPWSIDYEHADSMLFHYISSGSCWLRTQDGEPTPLRAGHVILLPTWKRVFLEAPLGTAAGETLRQMILDSHQPLWGPGHSTSRPVRISNEENGLKCEILSGVFGFEKSRSSFLLEQLPEIIIFDTRAVQMGPWLAQTLEFLAQEAQHDTPGYEAVATCVSDLILIQILRVYIHLHADQPSGWMKGLSDPHISKALIAVHRNPAHDWTVASLGREAGLSRSPFAERFTNKTGMTPLDYVTRWRMHLAAMRLTQTDLSIKKIGESVGYHTPFVFLRAFKRQYEVSPSTFRRNAKSSV